jgi:peptidoglycan-N-acetylmuramic acid deacetylase
MKIKTKTILTFIIASNILTGCASNSVSPQELNEKPNIEIPIEQRLEEAVEKDVYEPMEEVNQPEQEIPEEPELEIVEEPKEEPIQEQKPVQKPTKEASSLSNNKKSWWFKRNSDNLPPGAQSEIDIAKYDAYYLGNTNEKKIYLTFDEGYENGYTNEILDTLKEHDVKAAFFVTKPYIKSQQELVKRMVNEGHLVGNHSVSHPSLPDKTKEEIEYELNETARYFEEITSSNMPLFFRPPAGEYSERTLQITKALGYKTIFWSMAYKDWDVNAQPGKQAAYEHIVQNHHQGAIILLHAVSSSNTEALEDIIKYLKDNGYTFSSLNEL